VDRPSRGKKSTT
jgi:hypothetical protein